MNKNHLFEDRKTDQMHYANELSEVAHNIVSMNGLQLLKLIHPKVEKEVERRAHKRFQVNKDTFALIRPVSVKQIRVSDRTMGEIAFAVYRSKLTKFGRINNISMNGLSFRYIADDNRSTQPLVLDILMAECGFYLESLAFKNIADFEITDDFSNDTIIMKQYHMQFEGPTPDKVLKLKHLIRNYSICER